MLSLLQSKLKKIHLLFPRKYKDYIYEFNRIVNDQMFESAKETINDSMKTFESDNDFVFYDGYQSMKIKLIDLVNMYAETGKFRFNLEELIEHYFADKKKYIGGWAENQYEFEDVRLMDKDNFNWEIKKIFESILDELDDGSSYKDFLDLYDRISKKFPLEKFKELPRDKKIKFYIKSIDPETLKIEVRLSNGLRQITHSFSEENFYKLLYQPELFDILDKLKY